MRKAILAVVLSLVGSASVAWGQEQPFDGLSVVQTPTWSAPLWGNAEYLVWWVKSQPLSTPLLTTTTNPDITDANGNNVAGGVGRDGTVVVVGPGDQAITYGAVQGVRLTVGGWLNAEGTVGLEVRGFWLEQASFSRIVTSGPDGAFRLNFPIVDASGLFGGGENAIAIATPIAPADLVGSATVISHTRLWGAEANGVVNFDRNHVLNLDVLAGFRYAELSDDVTVIGQSTNITSFAAGGGVPFLNGFFDGTITSSDFFKSRNQFYGGQVGIRANAELERVYLNVTCKLAMGATHQEVDVRGFSTLQTANTTAQAPGGIYALPSNIGVRGHDAFSVIPELELRFGYKVTEHLQAFLGYNFMYWTNVARAGNQIDRTVDIRQVPTFVPYDPTVRVLPSPRIIPGGFSAQGFTIGLECHF